MASTDTLPASGEANPAPPVNRWQETVKIYFGSPLNSAISIICLVAIIFALKVVVQWMFIVTALIIVFNVFLTYLEAKGKDGLANKLDTYVIRWIYPMGYAAILGFAASRFLFT